MAYWLFSVLYEQLLSKVNYERNQMKKKKILKFAIELLVIPLFEYFWYYSCHGWKFAKKKKTRSRNLKLECENTRTRVTSSTKKKNLFVWRSQAIQNSIWKYFIFVPFILSSVAIIELKLQFAKQKSLYSFWNLFRGSRAHLNFIISKWHQPSPCEFLYFTINWTK